MTRLLTILLLTGLANTASAEDLLFAAPGGAVVQMDAQNCPDNMICVDAGQPDSDLNLIVPDWLDQSLLESRGEDAQTAAYVQGMSDMLVVDICDYCDCCTILPDPETAAAFLPWEAAPATHSFTPRPLAAEQ